MALDRCRDLLHITQSRQRFPNLHEGSVAGFLAVAELIGCCRYSVTLPSL